MVFDVIVPYLPVSSKHLVLGLTNFELWNSQPRPPIYTMKRTANHAVLNCADLRERIKTTSHCDRRGRIGDFRDRCKWTKRCNCYMIMEQKQTNIFNGSLKLIFTVSRRCNPLGLMASWVVACQLVSWRSVSKNPCTCVHLSCDIKTARIIGMLMKLRGVSKSRCHLIGKTLLQPYYI